MSTYADCRFSLDGARLTIGNNGIERVWDLSNGAPACVSVRDVARNREWAAPTVYRDAFHRADLPLASTPTVRAEANVDDLHEASEKHLVVTVHLTYPNAELTWTHRIWPEMPIIVSQYRVRKTGQSATPVEPEKFHDSGRIHLHPVDDRLDFFGVAPLHMTYHATTFGAQSDHHDNLVIESTGVTYPKEHTRLRGHYLHLSDRLTPGGLLAIKLAPPPDEQLSYPGFDFSSTGRALAIVGSGISAEEMASGEEYATYVYAIGVTNGCNESGIDLFHKLDCKRIRPNPKRNFAVMSNTWGDGRGSSKVSEEMFSAEIRTAARIGVTHCQIDAGWQKGDFRSLFVEENRPKGPYGVDPDFWTVHKDKFPRGMQPIADLAKEKGVRIGFWFVPDSTHDYGNWQKDVNAVLDMWRKYGFTAVKIDGVSLLNKRAEANFIKFLEGMYLGSNKELCINFDITGGKSWRLGHFYGTEFTGNLFIENRYALDCSYYTFRTMRNLWQLCRYVPSHRLHMEFVNPATNKENYNNDPLAPTAFGAEFSCAATLFCNPLCWMEIANLSPEDKKSVGRLLRAYHPHQEAVLTGRVYPIGEEPSGRAWTGFQSVTSPGKGYLILFREDNKRLEATFALRDVAPGMKLRVERIAGAGKVRQVKVAADSTIKFALREPRSYAFFRYEAT